MDSDIQKTRRALAANPDDVTLQERLARLLERRGKPYKSKRQQRKEAQKDYKPGTPEKLVKRARDKAYKRYQAEAKARAHRMRLAREAREERKRNDPR